MMHIWINGASRGLGFDILNKLKVSKNYVLTILTSYPSAKISEDINIISKSDDMKSLINNVSNGIKEFGMPDVIIHCAGGGSGSFTQGFNFDMFNEVFYKNFSHIIEINNLILQEKKEDKKIKIIHVGSIAATQAVGSIPYNVSKACLSAYVRSAGNQLIKSQVIVCGINIGSYYSDENAMARFQRNNLNEFLNFKENRIPWGELQTIDDVFPMFEYLIINDIKNLSGSMIPLDAGESKTYI